MARKIIAAAVLASWLMLGQSSQPDDPKDVFERGQRALAAGRYADAERDFDHLLQMGLRSAPVYTNLGVAHLRAGNIEGAIRMLKEAKKLAPAMTGIDLNLGLAYYKQREFKQAAPYFAAVLSADPTNIQAHYLNGICHFMMDEFDATVSALGPIEDREQNDLEYLFMLGISYGKLKRASDAQRIFARLVEAGGDTPHLHLLLGKAYLALDDYQNAQTELEKNAASDSRLPYSHYYLGMLYQKLGKSDAAAAEFEKETEISPNDPWAYEEFSKIKLDQGDTSAAISLLEKAVARNPDAPTLQAALAKGYVEASQPQRAIPRLKHAIELDPKNGNYHYQLGRAYLKAGRQREASAEMATARQLQVRVLKGQMEALSRDRSFERASSPVDTPK
jgi:tetratricopeptide (TPR) repeat protein